MTGVWWLVVIDSWVFGLGRHLRGFTMSEAFIHIHYITPVRSLSLSLSLSLLHTHANTHRLEMSKHRDSHKHTHARTRTHTHIWPYRVDTSPVRPTGNTIWDHSNLVSGGGGRKCEFTGGIHLKTVKLWNISSNYGVFPTIFKGKLSEKIDYINYT